MKWLWLSICAALFLGVAWFCLDHGWQIAMTVFGAIMLFFVVAAVAEFAIQYSNEAAVIYERNQRARYMSPVVMISEAIGHLHPEHMKLLYRFTARAVWDVKIDLDKRERDVMLRGTNIHLGFVEHVLDQSRNGELYPMNRFSEGSKEWDPDGVVTDWDQYREFELWLSTRLIVIRHYSNKAAVFLPPWTPALVKEAMGIADQLEYWSPAVKNVIKPLNDVMKSLPKKKEEAAIEGIITPTPEEVSRMKAVQAAHDARYGSGQSQMQS